MGSTHNSKMPSAKKAADPNKLKRPLNAYMMFANEKRPQHQKDYPELKITEIAKMIGEEWRSMSDDEKSPYTKEAKRLKAIYEKKKSACERWKEEQNWMNQAPM